MASASSVRGPRWRRATALVLLVVGSFLAAGSLVAVYARSELLNTDRYVATVEPLADQAAVRKALSSFIVTTVYRHVDVERLAREALPAQARFLAGPLTTGIAEFSRQVVDRFLASSTFRTLWVEANRLAHDQVLALIRDTRGRRVGPVTLRDGTVTVDLTKAIATAERHLSDAGLSFVNQIHVPRPRAQYRLISSHLLAQARGYVALLNGLAWGLPVLMAAAFGGAVLCWPDRRRGVVRVGLAFALAMALVLVALGVGRTLYVDAAVGSDVPRNAATAVFDTVLRYVHDVALGGILVGASLAFAAWVMSPSRVARRVRHTVRAAVGVARERTDALGLRPGPVAAYVAEHRSAVRLAATAVVLIVVVAWRAPTLGLVAVLAATWVSLLVAIELVGRAGALRPRPAPRGDTG